MTITAKFPSVCPNCGGAIKVGQKIEWSRGQRATHTACPVVHSGSDAPLPPGPVEGVIRISHGEGYGGQPYQVGQILATADVPRGSTKTDAEWLIVLSKKKTYYEDGMSFGVGDESGYIYSATCRPATPEEAAPIIAERAAVQAQQQAAAGLTAEHARIMREGEYLPREEGQPGHAIEGERINIGKGQTIYGGGEWFVLGPEWIWAIRNNGGDGDCWAHNNIATGGAGAVGRRVPTTPDLVERIRALAGGTQR